MKIKLFLLTVTSVALFSTVKAQQSALQQTAKGWSYHIFTANSGQRIKLGDVITFNVTQKTEKDSVLFSSYASGNPVKIQVQASQNIGDLMDVFPLLADKDSAVVKVPTDSIFKDHEDQRPAFLLKGSNLFFTLKMERVQSLDDAMAERNAAMAKMKAEIEKTKSAEAPAIQKYIADNKLVVKTTLSGLKYIVKSPTLKHKPLAGDTVLVNYTGRTLDGKVFDSSIESAAKEAGLQQEGRTYEPLSIVLGKGEVIKGWDEGLLLLNEGSKARFIIPSALAYGQNGAGNDIKPYTALVFDIELVKVKPGHHAAVKHVVHKAGTKAPVKKKPLAKN